MASCLPSDVERLAGRTERRQLPRGFRCHLSRDGMGPKHEWVCGSARSTGLSDTPERPGLSLTGVRLRAVRPHRMRFPCCVLPPFTDCHRQYSRSGWFSIVRSWDGLPQPFPRIQRRRPSPSLRKVGDHIGLFEACSTFTGYYGLSVRRVAKATHLSRRPRRFRFLHRRSDSWRLERPGCRVGFTPTEEQHLHTAHAMRALAGSPRGYKSTADCQARQGSP